MVYIYALIDPFSKEIRYIGKSTRPKERLANHCNEKAKSWRNHWIQSVLRKGKRPEISILETISKDSDWQAKEKEWIKIGREKGWKLTNCTDGGDGVVNLPKEIRDRIAKVWIGRKHSPESLKKIGMASRGRKKTAEMKEFMRNKMKGRKIEWKDKISASNKKLSPIQIEEIKKLLADKISQYVIADTYGVHQGTISNIKTGKFYQ